MWSPLRKLTCANFRIRICLLLLLLHVRHDALRTAVGDVWRQDVVERRGTNRAFCLTNSSSPIDLAIESLPHSGGGQLVPDSFCKGQRLSNGGLARSLEPLLARCPQGNFHRHLKSMTSIQEFSLFLSMSSREPCRIFEDICDED